MTTRDDIEAWLDDAPAGARWMMVMCDTFSHEDYPIYVDNAEQFWQRHDAATQNMGRLMESYDLHDSIPEQLCSARVMRLPPRPK